MQQANRAGSDSGLNDNEKCTLIELARAAILAQVKGDPPPPDPPLTTTLKEKRGAFVSLHRHGRLRGCIGHIIASQPLHRTVREMAIAAAFQDPRFDPLDNNELGGLDIEISVLTPLQLVNDISLIQVGKNGLMIQKGAYSGLLLPQVATQYGWDRQTFLENTCLKAGLPSDAWQDSDTKIYLFSADIF